MVKQADQTSLINKQASQLHRKDGFREKAVSKPTSSSFDGSKTSAGRGGSNRQLAGALGHHDLACCSYYTAYSAVEGSDGWKHITDNTGGLPDYTFQLIDITGRRTKHPQTRHWYQNLKHCQSQSDRTV